MIAYVSMGSYLTVLLLQASSLPIFLFVCAGFRRLLSLQASCRGEEGFIRPPRDAHQPPKRTTGKTGVGSRTAHFSAARWQQKAKRQIGLHTESCWYHKRKERRHQWQLVKHCILFCPRRSFHLSLWPNPRYQIAVNIQDKPSRVTHQLGVSLLPLLPPDKSFYLRLKFNKGGKLVFIILAVNGKGLLPPWIILILPIFQTSIYRLFCNTVNVDGWLESEWKLWQFYFPCKAVSGS